MLPPADAPGRAVRRSALTVDLAPAAAAAADAAAADRVGFRSRNRSRGAKPSRQQPPAALPAASGAVQKTAVVVEPRFATPVPAAPSDRIAPQQPYRRGYAVHATPAGLKESNQSAPPSSQTPRRRYNLGRNARAGRPQPAARRGPSHFALIIFIHFTTKTRSPVGDGRAARPLRLRARTGKMQHLIAHQHADGLEVWVSPRTAPARAWPRWRACMARCRSAACGPPTRLTRGP